MENTHREADRPATPSKGKGKGVELDVIRQERESISSRTTPSSEIFGDIPLYIYAGPHQPQEKMTEPQAPSEQDPFSRAMFLYKQKQKRYFEQVIDALGPVAIKGENEVSQSDHYHSADEEIYLAEPVGNKSRRGSESESDGEHSDTSDRGRYEHAKKSLEDVREALREIEQRIGEDERTIGERFSDLLQWVQRRILQIFGWVEQRRSGPGGDQEIGEGERTIGERFRNMLQQRQSRMLQRTGEGTSGGQSGGRVRRGWENESDMTGSDAMSDQGADDSLNATLQGRYSDILYAMRDMRVGTETSEGTSGGQSGDRDRQGSENESDMTDSDAMSDQGTDDSISAIQERHRRLPENRRATQERDRDRRGWEHESDMTDSDAVSDQESDDSLNATLQGRYGAILRTMRDMSMMMIYDEDSDYDNG